MFAPAKLSNNACQLEAGLSQIQQSVSGSDLNDWKMYSSCLLAEFSALWVQACFISCFYFTLLFGAAPAQKHICEAFFSFFCCCFFKHQTPKRRMLGGKIWKSPGRRTDVQLLSSAGYRMISRTIVLIVYTVQQTNRSQKCNLCVHYLRFGDLLLLYSLSGDAAQVQCVGVWECVCSCLFVHKRYITVSPSDTSVQSDKRQ